MKCFVNNLKDSFKLGMAFIIGAIYKVFYKDNIYLIGERKDQCQDNGYHLFKYVRENHKEDKFYYVITKDSNQLDKISHLGNIIFYGSFKHYLYYIFARKLVCAHVGSCTPDTPAVWKLEELKLIEKNRVFIQHGITKELIPSLMKNGSGITTFICGAKPEYAFVKEQFGYGEENVKYLGFCRFDNLHEINVKKQILIMPTWRQWFGMNGNSKVNKNEFENSTYFKTFNSLINNVELEKLIELQGYKVIFYPHHEMQRYIDKFQSESNNILIANKAEYDVQELLKESEILITDYSSIAFDFAYMKKSVIYYQFDTKEYYEKHYEKGYFDYERDGFGPIFSSSETMLNELNNILNGEFDNKFLKRVESFFEINDKNNCLRHYSEIIKCEGERYVQGKCDSASI